MTGVLPLPHNEVFSLRFKHVSFAHEGSGSVLQDVDFLFPSHPMVRLAGPEGSGISTLLKILGGLESPTQGEYRVNDQDLGGMTRADRAALQLAFGYGFDHGGLLSNYTLLDNLMLPMNYHQLVPVRDRELRAMAYLQHFGIEKHARVLPAFASAAARKCCALARAFLLTPRILVLDEPTESIHHAGAERLADLIQFHLKNLGLQQVFFATEDTHFLKSFDFETVKIAQKGLVNGAK